MSNVKQAHKVPAFYLESFVGQEPLGQVWNYDKLSDRRWSTKPENTAKQGYYYAVTGDDGTKNLTIENYLADVESKAKAGYQTLLNGNIPDDQIRANFSTFIATQFMRTSTMRQLWAEGYCRYIYEKTKETVSDKSSFDKFMEEEQKKTGVVFSDEKKEDIRRSILDPSGFILTVPQDMTIRALLPADDMMEAIYEMEWSIGHSEKEYFITGDNPVAAYNDEAFIRSGPSPKEIHYHPEVMIDFPLSPTSILVLSWRKMKKNFKVSDTRTIKANKERALRAHRFIYAHKNDDTIGQLALEYKNAKWGVRANDTRPEIPLVKVERD